MKKVNMPKIYYILKSEISSYNAPVAELIKSATKNPFKILVATILSARTKDSTTAAACKRLFKRVKKPLDLGKLSEKQLQKLIYPVGFYKNKARLLKQLPAALKKFSNKIPSSMEKLVQLPGVGRKTANIVLASAFNKPSIAVDVHVHRITNRLGYVKTKTPHQTEIALIKKLPKNCWPEFNTMLVAFGQSICRPVSPYCSKCLIKLYCKRVGVMSSR